MSLTLSTRPTIIDRVVPKNLAADITMVVVGTALTALAAQVTIPLYPVPLTGQTFAVLLVGTVLGFSRGALSMALYVLLGAAGLPIFQDGASGFAFGPTLGYLIGFVGAAALTGFMAERGWDKKWYQVALTFIAGSAVIYGFGLAWLSIFLGAVGAPNDIVSTMSAGLFPFLIGDAVKALAAAALLPAAWAGVKALKK
jgi:biotin transport system substrate-specific component